MWYLLALFVLLSIPNGSMSFIHYTLDEHCGTTLSVPSEQAVQVELSVNPATNSDCVVRFISFQRMTVNINNFAVDFDVGCDDEWMAFYEGPETSDPPLTNQRKYCGRSYPVTVLDTPGSYLTVRYVTGSSPNAVRKLKMILTAFTTRECHSDETRCDKGWCIDNSATCIGYNPCGDYSDCINNIRDHVNVKVLIGSIAAGVGVYIIIIIVICVIVSRHRRNAARRNDFGEVRIATNGTVLSPPPPYPGQGQGQYPGQYGGQVPIQSSEIKS